VTTDPFLRRLESTAIVACLAMAALALAISGGRAGPALGVLAGGMLTALSYWTIGSGVTSLGSHASPDAPRAKPRLAWIVTKVLGRYALLVLLAYVMIARLRLSPLGLLAGASSVVAAASVEAARLLLKKS
jgi:ATP synthase I subunit